MSVRDRTCLVTGATSGHGQAVATALARQGAKVIIHGRSRERCHRVQQQIAVEAGREPEVLLCDLSKRDDIDRAADELLERIASLHLLVNNAGAVWQRRAETVDGAEMTFAVNYLAAFQLTMRLVDRLVESAPARIVNVSSEMHRLVTLDFDDLMCTRRYSWHLAYSRSKLALISFTRELARRLDGTGVTVNAVDPGPVRSSIGRNNGGVVESLLPIVMRFFPSANRACETAVHLATSPYLEGVTGRYYRFMEDKAISERHRDPSVDAQLWRASVELTGVDSPHCS